MNNKVKLSVVKTDNHSKYSSKSPTQTIVIDRSKNIVAYAKVLVDDIQSMRDRDIIETFNNVLLDEGPDNANLWLQENGYSPITSLDIADYNYYYEHQTIKPGWLLGHAK